MRLLFITNPQIILINPSPPKNDDNETLSPPFSCQLHFPPSLSSTTTAIIIITTTTTTRPHPVSSPTSLSIADSEITTQNKVLGFCAFASLNHSSLA